MKKLSVIFGLLAVLLSDVLCAVVAFHYRDMLCCIEHTGCSAPADVAFLLAIPFVVGIVVCAILAVFFRRKAER